MIIKEIRISKGKRHNFVIGFNMCQYVFESAEKRSKAFCKVCSLTLLDYILVPSDKNM